MKYYLKMYGGEGVQDTESIHDTLSEAVEEAEAAITSDHDGWEPREDGIRLVDHNNGHGAVINVIEFRDE